MKHGSLFSGIGGWELAAQRFGIRSVWASEIESFPIQVTKIRFPNVKHLGDITKINGAEIEPVDVITFGSPCQDLSVAGKRSGMKVTCPECGWEYEHSTKQEAEEEGCPLCGAMPEQTRSNLFHEAVRIIREMRGATNGQYPRFAVWENVTGAFSSNKGFDFKAVLEEIAEADVPIPRSGRWAPAGMVRGKFGSLAWRTLDAQYWGVPQRRKRIFLVADFGGGCAGQILFKPEGVSRYIAESGSEREGLAGGFEGGVGTTVVRMRSGCDGGGEGALVSEEKSLTLATGNDQTLFVPMSGESNDKLTFACSGFCNYTKDTVSATQRSVMYKQTDVDLVLEKVAFGVNEQPEIAHCLRAGVTPTIVLSTQDTPMLFEPRSQDGVPRIHGDICPTLNTAQGGQRQPCVVTRLPDREVVMEPIPINDKATRYKGGGDSRNNDGSGNGLGVGKPGDPMPTLTAGDRHVVAFSFDSLSSNSMKSKNPNSGCREVEVAKCIDTTNPCPSKNQGGIAIISAIDCRNLYENKEISGTLQSKPGGGYSLNYINPVRVKYLVRRLTPLECERLQGLPDNWTNLPGASDTPRYKAIGNGMAQPDPDPDYVMEGIAEVLYDFLY